MGYTHYWKIKENLDQTKWDEFADGALKVIQTATEAGIAIEDESTKSSIFFNGVGSNSHETFVINWDDAKFNFCKTAQKPYDTVVTAVLIWFKTVFGDGVIVTSDGDWKDWEGGAVLFETVFDIQPESVLA